MKPASLVTFDDYGAFEVVDAGLLGQVAGGGIIPGERHIGPIDFRCPDMGTDIACQLRQCTSNAVCVVLNPVCGGGGVNVRCG